MPYPKLHSKYLLAPMAGVTDSAFRMLCKQQGAGMTFTEFISAEAIIRDNPVSRKLLSIGAEESPVGVQIFGNDPQSVERAARFVEPIVDAVDFNMGCPAWHVFSQGSGCALMQDPALVRELLSRMRAVVHKPLSVKIRAGIDESRINCVEIARIAESCGVDAITVHPRTQKQGYSGVADWTLIKAVKDAVSIPVFGNGDVRTPEDAQRMLRETGCDAVMIGRAGKDSPWLFRQCLEYERTGTYTPVTDGERATLFAQYLELAQRYSTDFTRVRMQVAFFTKGMRGGAQLREQLLRARTIEELRAHYEKQHEKQHEKRCDIEVAT
jgi:nifR3 family TIM-barrel protein